jgi:hypothetical protein
LNRESAAACGLYLGDDALCTVWVTGIVHRTYDRQVLESLKTAVAMLDDGQPFKILSRSDDPTAPVESVSSTH